MTGHYRIGALDGLRAIAVLAVVGLHLGVPLARGGGYGVDMFFVLSGFLITSLLLAEFDETGSISCRDFYMRRALRLFPALAVTLVLSVVLDVTAEKGGGHLATAIPSVVFYVGNWVVSFNNQALGFLGQTWSLAIEEQFYLIWPFLLLIPRVRTTMTRWLPWAIVGSAGGRIILHAAWSSRVDVWTPLRADGLLLGALVAVHARDRSIPAWIKKPMAPAIAITVATPLVTRNVFASYSDIGMAVVAVCTAVVVAHLSVSNSTASRLLSQRPLIAVGRVSYGIYLYHAGIILWLLADGYSRPVLWPVVILFTAVATAASWRWIERPAMRSKHRFERARLEMSSLTLETGSSAR